MEYLLSEGHSKTLIFILVLGAIAVFLSFCLGITLLVNN